MCIFLSHMGLPEAVNILDQKSEELRRGSSIPPALLLLGPEALALQRPCCLGTAVRISEHRAASSPVPAGLPRCQQVRDEDRLAAVEMGWRRGVSIRSAGDPGFRLLRSPQGHHRLRFLHILSQTLVAPGAPAPGGALTESFLVMLVQSLPLAFVLV